MTTPNPARSNDRFAADEPSRPGAPSRTGLFIVGAGYVGLVTAVGLVRLGHHVTLADIDAARIEVLREGHVPIFEPGLEEALAEVRDRIEFTTDLHPPPSYR